MQGKRFTILIIYKTMTTKQIKNKLEFIRQAIRNENVSYSEIAELESLSDYIDRDDVELLEVAGIPEFN